MPRKTKCIKANTLSIVQVTGGLVGVGHLLINSMETQFVAATIKTLLAAPHVGQLQITSSFNSPFKTLRLGQPRLEHLCQF